jgi:hypothetical protein
MFLHGARDFILLFAQQATIAGSWPVRVTKVIVFLLTIASAFSADSKVAISLAKDKHAVTALSWHPELGTVIWVLVVVIWAAIALGVACAKFRHIEIGENLEHCPVTGYYRLSIVNKGLVAIDLPVHAVAVAESEKLISRSQLPLELEWMHNRTPVRPLLRRGKPAKVDVFKIAWGTQIRNGVWHTCLHFTGLSNVFIDLGVLSSSDKVLTLSAGPFHPAIPVGKTKLWIAITIGDEDERRWFSLEAGEHPNHVKTTPERPPFLPAKRSAASMWISWLEARNDGIRRLIHGIKEGWNATRKPPKPRQRISDTQFPATP